MMIFDVLREIRELKNKFSYSKNIGFFFGAGTSCALGIPDITTLTQNVESDLDDKSRQIFQIVKADLSTHISGRPVNIEDILNQLRRIREITQESEKKAYLDICGKDAMSVDTAICKSIYKNITEQEVSATFNITKRFFSWYNLINRDYVKEVFTTNYDLVFEKSLEASKIPYFDGFVGAYEPFFCQESIDHRANSTDMTKNWIRLWKIHGSLSWFWRLSETTKSYSIIRIGNIGTVTDNENELVIYPSKDKYDSSRKQPFIAYFDRMRTYLLAGELLFVISGYSFSDQHINEIIFNSMRQNNHLFVIAFLYNDIELENLHQSYPAYLNLQAFSPSKAIINGELGEWVFKKEEMKPNEIITTFWSEDTSHLKLGDFNSLVSFLVASSGNLFQQDSADHV